MLRKIVMTGAFTAPLAASPYAGEDRFSARYPLSAEDQQTVDDVVSVMGEGRREAIHMQIVWANCTKSAVDRFSAQAETARAVAEAAMASCTVEETLYMVASGIRFPESIRETSLPELTARVMSNRAALGR